LLDNLSENEILTCGGPDEDELPPAPEPELDEEPEDEEESRRAADLLSVDGGAWAKRRPVPNGVLE
jgi:hypothetical protein